MLVEVFTHRFDGEALCFNILIVLPGIDDIEFVPAGTTDDPVILNRLLQDVRGTDDSIIPCGMAELVIDLL